MRADQLHVVTSRYNPIRYAAPNRIFHEWAEHILDSGAQLHVVECVYGDQQHVCKPERHVDHIPVRADSWTFCKENLLNLGIARLPDDAKHIAWIDSDVFFRRPDWASETVHALQHYRVVQPWADCYDLGPQGEHMNVHRSFARQYHHGHPIGPTSWKKPYCFPHPGFAWAILRRIFNLIGGLFDCAVMGSGDHHMAYGMVGQILATVPKNASQNYINHLLRWEKLAQPVINGRIGFVKGTIEHKFHGAKRNRGYQDRWKIFTKHQMDPLWDLKRNAHGVLEWAGNKPELEREFDLYMRSRQEDSNDTMEMFG